MVKRIYISADYDWNSGDRNVVDELNKWGKDNYHKVDFTDMAKVVSGSVSKNSDCRACDLKAEFNQQINLSSIVIFIVGDKTAIRTSGSSCNRESTDWLNCKCTPYKQNTNGIKSCKYLEIYSADPTGDVGYINSYSYLRHEFEQAVRKQKQIVILYNSKCKHPKWLPDYMAGYEDVAVPFWIENWRGERVGNYQRIKELLEYE